MRNPAILALGMLLLVSGASAQKEDIAAKLGYPQWIVYNAKLVTMDDDSFQPRVGKIVQAMAIRDSRILATGGNAEIRALAGPQTKQLDMKGRTVMPGIIDTHDHPTANWVFTNYRAFHHAFPNDDTIVARWMDYMPPKQQLARLESTVKEALSKAKPGEGIMIQFNSGENGEFGRELEQLLSKSIRKEYLDVLAPDNPLEVAGVFNQKAIDELARIHPTVKDVRRPDFLQVDNSGAGVRDFATGRWLEPDVLLKGNAAAIGQLYRAELEDWASAGFVAIGDAAYGFNQFRALDYLDRRGELPVRDAWGYMGPNYDEETLRWFAPLTGTGTDHLWYIGMWERIGSDCTKATIKAEFLEAHHEVKVGERRGTRFCNFAPGTEGREILDRMISTGNRIATMHTWGDIDIDNYMDAIEEVSQRAGMTLDQIRAKRHAMDHSINAPRLDQIPRLKKLGMMVSANPKLLLYQPMSEQLVELFGIEQANQAAPRKSLTEGQVMSTFELDAGVPHHAFLYMKVSMDRVNPRDGRTYGPSQKVDRTIMLKAMTRWGAYYMLRENSMGSLEPGKFADFIVLDKDILTVPDDQIPGIKVLMTSLGGRMTHLAPSLATELGMQPVGVTTWKEPVPRGWKRPGEE